MSKYNIKQLSKLADVPSSTIRYYEKIGLLDDVNRDRNNYREFDQSHVKCLNVIKNLRNVDMSIEEIIQVHQKYQNGVLTSSEMEKILLNQSELIEQQILLLKEKQKQIKKFQKLINS